MHTNNASLEAFSLCNQTEGASYATVRYCRGGIGSPFQPDFIGTAFTKNILTGADFKQPRVKSLLDRLVEFLNQKVQP